MSNEQEHTTVATNRFTIALPPALMQQLQARATSVGIAPEDILRIAAELLLATSDAEFCTALQRYYEHHQMAVHRRLA